MKVRDMKSFSELAVLFATAQVTATQSIQGTEVADFGGKCFVVDVGTHTADDLTVTFQHRDGSDSWADIPDAQLDYSGGNDIAIVSSMADSKIYVGYTGNKEDIGAKITDGGTGDAVVGVYVLKGFPKNLPVN